MPNIYGLGTRDIEEGLAERIRAEIEHYGGKLTERVAVAWHGYLAACIEWGVISVAGHAELTKLLPSLENDPSIDILLGR